MNTVPDKETQTPGYWTSGAKDGIGKSINAASEVTFTIGNGVIQEVYYPREDIACIRTIELAVWKDDKEFREGKDTSHRVRMKKPGIPAYRIDNECSGVFILRKEVITDPVRNTLLQKVRLIPKGNGGHWRLQVRIYPHLHTDNDKNKGWAGNYKGIDMLLARRDDQYLALACSTHWKERAVDNEDGWLVLRGEIGLTEKMEVVLAMGFGRTQDEAGYAARASLLGGFRPARKQYIREWKQWLKPLQRSPGRDESPHFRTSGAVLRMNEAKRFPGGILASLSIPWGEVRSDTGMGGYHLVWCRDLVETAWGFLALNAMDAALRVLNYLMATQEHDGRWPQNMWLGGKPYYHGIQMDQMALPLLLADSCLHAGIIDEERLYRYWPSIRKAAAYLVRYGPSTRQDRWEQQEGLTPFTLATEVAALLAAAHMADQLEPGILPAYLRATADHWNANIEEWTWVTGTGLADRCGVQGYYIRINPFMAPAARIKEQVIRIKHHPDEEGKIAVGDMISTDALALVRFGLRSADDKRILDTLQVIDTCLKVQTPGGPAWHRFNKDAYGETVTGDPFRGMGRGRAWPLLTGERAHYEIAAGHPDTARELLEAMDSFSHNGLLPEQVWDQDDIPEKGLFRGRPTGSAMPLTWAHAEHIKLCRSLKEGCIFDMPRHTRERYIDGKTEADTCIWRFDRCTGSLQPGHILRIEVFEPALIRWTRDDWRSQRDTKTTDTGLGIHFADISPGEKAVTDIRFTFYWTKTGQWENRDFSAPVTHPK